MIKPEGDENEAESEDTEGQIARPRVVKKIAEPEVTDADDTDGSGRPTS